MAVKHDLADPVERRLLMLRHKAAMRVIDSTPPEQRWQLLSMVLVPGEDVRRAQERMAA